MDCPTIEANQSTEIAREAYDQAAIDYYTSDKADATSQLTYWDEKYSAYGCAFGISDPGVVMTQEEIEKFQKEWDEMRQRHIKQICDRRRSEAKSPN